jgi:hypothetical protein
MGNTTSNVAGLCGAWIEAKRREEEAKKARIKIEDELSAALEKKSEGSITHKVGDYKVVLTQPIYRKIDESVWHEVKTNIQPDLWPIKQKIEVDDVGVRFLVEHMPDMWGLIAKAFTVTPGKVGVKVTE